jgi:hypothetical protein
MSKVKIHESFDKDEVNHIVKKLCVFANLKPENFQVDVESVPSVSRPSFMMNKTVVYLVGEHTCADVLKGYAAGYLEAWQDLSGMQWEASMNSEDD